MFSSKSFILLGLMFRSLIHFKLFLQMVLRQGFNFIVLHVAVQLFQNYFLKDSSSPLNGLENPLTRDACDYFQTLTSVSYILMGHLKRLSLLSLKMVILARWPPMKYTAEGIQTQSEAQGRGKGRCVKQNRLYFRVSSLLALRYHRKPQSHQEIGDEGASGEVLQKQYI